MIEPSSRLAIHLLGIVLAISLAMGGAACATPQPADLVLRNGRIVTLDGAGTEVRALAARDGVIVALGSDEDVVALAGPGTRVVDLEGRLAIPGFIEGHAHFMGLGEKRLNLDVGSARSWEAVVEEVAAAVARTEPGKLIEGRGWHQEKWDAAPSPAVDGLPVHHGLSRVSPDHPVLLSHASGHAVFANARAMELAGIDRDTPNPPGGEIVHDANGEPIGVFRETAGELFDGVVATHGQHDHRRKAELAARESLAKGITTFQDAGLSFEEVGVLADMARADELGLRLWVMLREPNEVLARRLPLRLRGVDPTFLRVGGLKRSIDGALGSHGAWLLEPYADMPWSAGLNTATIPEIEETARLALEHDLQLCVHAIGDRANRETLDLFERVMRAHPDGRDLRWRVEHAQHLDPADVPRFAELGVIASMQAIHCISDAPWVDTRLGETRAREGAYVWRALIDSGAVVTNGTDAPVEDVDPIANFHASVSRRLADGSIFYGEQAMDRDEALRAYTFNAAYSTFDEDRTGSLEVGKLADVVVLSRDILSIPEQEILGTEVLMTLVGGKVLHERAESPSN